MDDVQTGTTGNANPNPEEVYQDAPMPSAEQQPTETEGDTGELPEGVSDRTRENYEKLLARNREMAEKLKKYESSSVFDLNLGQVPTTHPSQQPVDAVTSKFVDENGYVDVEALNKTLLLANQKAQQAEAIARQLAETQRKQEEARQEREAYAKYPWLNPNSPEMDPAAIELVRDRLVRNYVNGVQQDLVDVADQVLKVYKPQSNEETVKKEAVEQFKKAQQSKAVASSVSDSKPQRVETDYENLRERTLSGDEEAIRRRIEEYHNSLK